MHDLELIKLKIHQFSMERDWDQFHSPKNLSMALVVEAAELVEHFQWLTEKQSHNLSENKIKEVEEELADIQIYLVRIADKLNIDLIAATNRKLEINEKKYPVSKVKGNSKKYTEY